MTNQKRLLIISAHADDHVACAGTVFKLQTEQDYVPYELVLTNSELGQNFRVKKEISANAVAKTRLQELTKASTFLGIQHSYQLNEADLNLHYSEAIMFRVVSIIREVRPDILFIHNLYDAHPDHKAAYEISVNAVKIAAFGVKIETCGVPFRVPMVLCNEGMLPIKTQILVDITKYLEKKTQLFEIYESQANSKAVNFEKGLAVVRGYHLRKEGSQYAEAFTLQEEYPVLFFEK